MRFYLYQKDINPHDHQKALDFAEILRDQYQVPVFISDNVVYAEIVTQNNDEEPPLCYGHSFRDPNYESNSRSLLLRSHGIYYTGRERSSAVVLILGHNSFDEADELKHIDLKLSGSHSIYVSDEVLLPPIPELCSMPLHWHEHTKHSIRLYHQYVVSRYQHYTQQFAHHGLQPSSQRIMADMRLSIMVMNILMNEENNAYRSPVENHVSLDSQGDQTEVYLNLARNLERDTFFFFRQIDTLYEISKKSLFGSSERHNSQFLNYCLYTILILLLCFPILTSTLFLGLLTTACAIIASVILFDIRIGDSKTLFHLAKNIEMEMALKKKLDRAQSTYADNPDMQHVIETIRGSTHLTVYESTLWFNRVIDKIENRSNYLNLVKTLFNSTRLREVPECSAERVAIHQAFQAL